MLEKILQLLQKDIKIAMLAVLLFVLYHLSLYLKTFIDKEGTEKAKCEEKVERLEKQNDSANSVIINLLKLNQMRNDTSR